MRSQLQFRGLTDVDDEGQSLRKVVGWVATKRTHRRNDLIPGIPAPLPFVVSATDRVPTVTYYSVGSIPVVRSSQPSSSSCQFNPGHRSSCSPC